MAWKTYDDKINRLKGAIKAKQAILYCSYIFDKATNISNLEKEFNEEMSSYGVKIEEYKYFPYYCELRLKYNCDGYADDCWVAIGADKSGVNRINRIYSYNVANYFKPKLKLNDPVLGEWYILKNKLLLIEGRLYSDLADFLNFRGDPSRFQMSLDYNFINYCR